MTDRSPPVAGDTTNTMMAVVTTGQGGYEKLEYRQGPMPQPAPGKVLLQVLATGMNNTASLR